MSSSEAIATRSGSKRCEALAERLPFAGLCAQKRRLLAHYDPPAISKAVAICHWGRSGSILLASYLDGHPDVLVMPNLTSERIYPFLDEYGSLTLWEKLLAYPDYSARARPGAGDLFLAPNPDGDFATSPTHYHAAVQVLFEAYGSKPEAWLDARQRFIQFLHVAYALANGQQPTTPRPLIAYAQHWFDEELARRFVEDFPQARFIHTVRDPISALNSWYELFTSWHFAEHADEIRPYRFSSFDALNTLLSWDRAHAGAQSRSCALRFEDMHLQLPLLMRRLASWLDIPYREQLLSSTLNGRPYVFQSANGPRCGANTASAVRASKYLNACDRLLVGALFYEDFLRWRYPVPPLLRRRSLRWLVILLFVLVPMRIEWLNDRRVVRQQMLPALRAGRWRFFLRGPVELLWRRLRMAGIIVRAARERVSGRHVPLEPL
ncbi:MAG TPA: sulfotransferase [Steroidobacteraceae bacterium]|nr:sulfotransferase [Steroidobacteraceae bacterium]